MRFLLLFYVIVLTHHCVNGQTRPTDAQIDIETTTKVFDFTDIWTSTSSTPQVGNVTFSIKVPENGTILPNPSIFKSCAKDMPPEVLERYYQAVGEADELVHNTMELVEKIGQSGGAADSKAPTALHQSLMNGTEKQREQSFVALGVESISRSMRPLLPDFECTRLEEVEDGPAQRQFSRRCWWWWWWKYYAGRCDINDPYRTYDGSCNNLNNLIVGKTGTPVIRLVPNDYEDDISFPRTFAEDGSPLPSPRTVSRYIARDYDRTETVQTLMLMQWGQFVDHDLILSPTFNLGVYGGAQCCPEVVEIDGQFVELPLGRVHPECLTIDVAADDPFFSQFNKTCLDFVRTQGAQNIHCTMGPREQMNSLSHYLDGGMVYGSETWQNWNLRKWTDGKLIYQDDDMLPEGFQGCPSDCFRAGDSRANEQVGLAFTHTMWMREHNRVAQHFVDLGLVDDEEIFQKARRIVIAEIEHITYNEFLPVIIGKSFMQEHNLAPTGMDEYFEGYDEWLDPSISNVFGTVAYRFGHSMIQGLIDLPDGRYKVPFKELVFNPTGLKDQEYFLNVARGMVGQGSQICDAYFVNDVKNELFRDMLDPTAMPFGLDLIALNVQRGRDHGLPSYTQYRRLCGSPDITNFEDLCLPKPELDALKAVYNHVDDIDPFIGMLLERPEEGGIVGPTFRCLIFEQFFRTKYADRYWYENIDQPNPFTNDELNAIKRDVTLSSIFCDNVDGFTEVQPWSFYKPNEEWNKITACADIPSLDLSVFS